MLELLIVMAFHLIAVLLMVQVQALVQVLLLVMELHRQIVMGFHQAQDILKEPANLTVPEHQPVMEQVILKVLLLVMELVFLKVLLLVILHP